MFIASICIVKSVKFEKGYGSFSSYNSTCQAKTMGPLIKNLGSSILGPSLNSSHCHSCAFAHLNYVFSTATPIVKNTYKVILNKSSSLCKTDSVRNMMLHSKLVKGSFPVLFNSLPVLGDLL